MAEDPVGEVERQLLPYLPDPLGVAVSGGGDSVALLHILQDLAKSHGTRLCAVTVDHGLRKESGEEAAGVARLCAGLDVPHAVLRWDGWNGQGNLQSAAREARYSLIADWARSQGVTAVALGHTADDQAETVLMRLARGSGVDGLSAMVPRRMSEGIKFLRPLLRISRQSLRSYLKERCVPWIEDPSNDDMRFDRVKARHALKLLEPLGIDAGSLGQVAFNMARARDALDWQTFVEARRITRLRHGAILIDWRAYRTLPEEIARRLLLRAIAWVGGSDYGPRRLPLLRLIDALKQNRGGTLEGCFVRRFGESIWVFREYNAVRDLRCDVDTLWDGHWRMSGTEATGDLEIAALGEKGLLQCKDWRASGVPRDVLIASPAVWSGPDLTCAPLALHGSGWQLRSEKDEEGFFAALLSH
jgi:tRNA(Ile)-lysidine synthase